MDKTCRTHSSFFKAYYVGAVPMHTECPLYCVPIARNKNWTQYNSHPVFHKFKQKVFTIASCLIHVIQLIDCVFECAIQLLYSFSRV